MADHLTVFIYNFFYLVYFSDLSKHLPALHHLTKYFIVMVCVICGHYAQAQNQYNKWYFGYQAGLDFMTSPPTPIAGVMNTDEGCASISDAAGNLLFYTNGSTIWNQNHTIMGNGTNLGGNFSTTQSSNIVKQPGNSNIYFVFCLGASGNGNLRYSVVDMSLAAGLGSVTTSAVLISSNNTEKMTSVRHCNGKDFWLLCSPAAQGTLNAYLITAAGVNTVPVISSLPSLNSTAYGNMKTSPNGRQIAFANLDNGTFDLCDFDNSTGLASNAINLGSGFVGPYGVEFSSDGSKLYGTTCYIPYSLHQWDLCAGSATAIAASIYTDYPPSYVFGMQLATDGKIYVARYNAINLAVINNPNNSGSACNYVHTSNFNLSSTCRYNLPNFTSSDFNPAPGYNYTLSNCGKTASFSAAASQNFQTNGCSAFIPSAGVAWNFGDPGSGLANTSTLTALTHTFTNIGNYTVSLIVYNANMCTGNNDTTFKIITVPFCVSVQNQSITCASLGSATVTPQNGVGPFNYTWMPSGQTSSIATGLNPGTHTLFAYDIGTGLTYSTTTSFISLVPFTGTVSNSSMQSCATANSSTASIALSGGSNTQNYTWTSPTGVQTNSIATTLGAGTHTVTVIDALTSCSLTQTFYISKAPYTGSVSNSPSQSCASANSSTASINISGGSASVNYTWTSPTGIQTNSLATGLGVGIHTVTVIDALSFCTVTQTFYIARAPYTATVTNSAGQSCATTNTGIASISISGGSGNQTYIWNGPYGIQTSSIASGLGVGVYTVTVTDAASSCSVAATFSILLLPYTGTVTNSPSPLCFGINSGTASIAISGGSGSQSYIWSGPTGVQTTSIATGLSAGYYSVTVTDAVSSCSLTRIFSLNPSPPLLGLNMYASSPSVCAGAPVILWAYGTGGVPVSGSAYTTSWTAGPSTEMYTAVPLIAGTINYTATITDANNCVANASIPVTVVANPLLTLNSVSICPQQSATLTAGGASTYNWSNGLTTNSISSSPLATIVYTVTGTVQTCSSVATASIVVNALPVPTLSSNSPVCSGKTLNLFASGGGTYLWNGPASFTSALQNPQINPGIINNTGIYNVTVTAANSCTAAAVISLTVDPTPSLTTQGSTVCTTQTINLFANATAAITYTWFGPGGFISSLSNVVINNPPLSASGIYSVWVTASNGCTNSAVANVIVGALPSPSFSSNSPQCEGNTLVFNSSASLGGTVYNWSGPNAFTSSAANPQIANVIPAAGGLYTLTLTEGPCAVNVSQHVSILPAPTPIINTNAPLCEKNVLSMAVNTVYTLYQWAGPLSFTNTNQSFSIPNADLSHSGNYSVVVTDTNTCQGMTSVSVTVMPNPTLTVAGAHVCYGDAALINASGAVSYSWTGPSGFAAFTAQATISPAINTSPFVYYVIGRAANSCTTASSVLVSTKVLPIAKAGLTQRACVNTPIYFNAEGGINYSWTGPLGFSNSSQNFSTMVSNSAMSGNYTLMVIDTAGCKGYTAVNFIADAVPQGSLWKNNIQNCVPFCANFKFMPVGAPIVTSNWQINGQTFLTDTLNYCFTAAGEYTLRGDFTDNKSCKNTASFVIHTFPLPKANFNYFPQVVIEGNEVLFESNSTGLDINSYGWYLGNNDVSGINHEQLNYVFTDPGVYPVALVIKNKWGCEDTIVKAITVSEEFQVYVPNAFTPNGYNTNEIFKAVGRGVKTFALQIFNRWGQLLYQSSDIHAGWDGSYKGGFCKEDVYNWLIEVTSIRGKEEKLSGSVLLYR